jgi:tetratricopeptide (TPR) repeat protein
LSLLLTALVSVAIGALAPADTLHESAPALLLVPGRAAVADSLSPSPEAVARSYYRKGRELEETGAYAAAIMSYRLALTRDPDLPDANYRIGRLFLRVNQVGEAAASFAAELVRHPGHAPAARELGLAWTRLGEPERAIAQLELLTRRQPKEGENWRALGYAYSGAGRLADAERALRRAIALPPANAVAHRDLGFVLAATNRPDEARAEYGRALAIAPDDAGTRLNLGSLDRRQGDAGAALDEYRAAERLDSTLTPALKGQAAVLMELNRQAEAGAVYRRLLALEPADVETRFAAVRLFDALGRSDVALELARDGVRHDRGSADARLILGLALEAQDDRRGAARELRRAEALSPDSTHRARARSLLDALSRQASDSLRTVFAADSADFARTPAVAPRSGHGRARPTPGPAAPAPPSSSPMAVPPERTDSLFLPVAPDSQ